MVEQRPFKAMVGGPNPPGCTLSFIEYILPIICSYHDSIYIFYPNHKDMVYCVDYLED